MGEPNPLEVLLNGEAVPPILDFGVGDLIGERFQRDRDDGDIPPAGDIDIAV